MPKPKPLPAAEPKKEGQFLPPSIMSDIRARVEQSQRRQQGKPKPARGVK